MPKEWVSIEFDDGAIFFLDYLQRQLRECDNPANVMLLRDMEDRGTHYEFIYDPATTNIAAKGIQAGPDEGQPYVIKIPPMSQWHLFATAQVFGMEETDIKGLSDQEFFNLPYVAELKEFTDTISPAQVALLEDRLKGVLPQLTIGHERYEVDWANKQLNCLMEDGKRINMKAMEMNADGTAYLCLYNQRLGVVADPKFQHQHYPDLVLLSIPYEMELDPVGVARQYGLKDYELLNKFPIKETLEAKLTPVGKQVQKIAKTKKLKVKQSMNRKRL